MGYRLLFAHVYHLSNAFFFARRIFSLQWRYTRQSYKLNTTNNNNNHNNNKNNCNVKEMHRSMF